MIKSSTVEFHKVGVRRVGSDAFLVANKMVALPARISTGDVTGASVVMSVYVYAPSSTTDSVVVPKFTAINPVSNLRVHTVAASTAGPTAFPM